MGEILALGSCAGHAEAHEHSSGVKLEKAARVPVHPRGGQSVREGERSPLAGSVFPPKSAARFSGVSDLGKGAGGTRESEVVISGECGGLRARQCRVPMGAAGAEW